MEEAADFADDRAFVLQSGLSRTVVIKPLVVIMYAWSRHGNININQEEGKIMVAEKTKVNG
jgi:hypothetical protein